MVRVLVRVDVNVAAILTRVSVVILIILNMHA